MKNTYKILQKHGLYRIVMNVHEDLKTSPCTTFQISDKTIADRMLKDLIALGPESYTDALSSLCYAFTYDNMITNCNIEAIQHNLSELPYEEDFWFQPAFSGLPPARVIWDLIFYDANRANEVREWIKRLSRIQVAAICCVFQATENMNMAYLFGKMLEDGNLGMLENLKNLYNNLLSSSLDGEYIERLFDVFKIFYTSNLK